MQYSLKIKANPALIKFLNNPSPEIEKTVENALNKSLKTIQRSIQGKTPRRTGELQRSIEYSVKDKKVFTNLFYSLFVERGAYIKRKRRKALRWFDGGRPVFAKYVRVKPRKFFYSGAKESYREVIDIFTKTFRELLERL